MLGPSGVVLNVSLSMAWLCWKHRTAPSFTIFSQKGTSAHALASLIRTRACISRWGFSKPAIFIQSFFSRPSWTRTNHVFIYLLHKISDARGKMFAFRGRHHDQAQPISSEIKWFHTALRRQLHVAHLRYATWGCLLSDNPGNNLTQFDIMKYCQFFTTLRLTP